MRRIDATPANCNCLPSDVQVIDTEHGPRFSESPTEAKGDGSFLAAALDRADAEARAAAQAGPPAGALVRRTATVADERDDRTAPPACASFRR